MQVYVPKYFNRLLNMIERADIDPTFLISHTFPLREAAKAYELFDRVSVK